MWALLTQYDTQTNQNRTLQAAASDFLDGEET